MIQTTKTGRFADLRDFVRHSPELLALLGLLLSLAAGTVLWGAIAAVIWIAAQ
jgi:hypothetical protein